jgi:hypothetical protein
MNFLKVCRRTAMIIRKTRMNLIALTTAAAVLAGLWVTWGSGRVAALQEREDMPSPFGLARGQTARLTIFNGSARAIVGPEYRFFDSQGRVLAESTDNVPVMPGQFQFFDFEVPDPPPGIADRFGRIQVRAVARALGGPDTKIRTSLEVFDNATGRTSFVIQPPPEPDLRSSPPPEPD